MNRFGYYDVYFVFSDRNEGQIWCLLSGHHVFVNIHANSAPPVSLVFIRGRKVRERVGKSWE